MLHCVSVLAEVGTRPMAAASASILAPLKTSISSSLSHILSSSAVTPFDFRISSRSWRLMDRSAHIFSVTRCKRSCSRVHWPIIDCRKIHFFRGGTLRK